MKTLKESAADKEKKDLQHELAVMKMLDPHPNVVRLLGCCTEKDPIFVILEFVSGGTLQVNHMLLRQCPIAIRRWVMLYFCTKFLEVYGRELQRRWDPKEG